MSNITRQELERIYNTYHIVFLNIAKEAKEFNVDLEIDIEEEGRIKLTARDYTEHDVTRWYELSQDEECITYEERAFKRKSV